MDHNTLQQTTPDRRQEEQQDRHPAKGCLLRAYWMLLGNALVALFAYRIMEMGGAITVMDIFYWLGAASLVIVRYVDIRFLGGRTGEGEPATMKHWRGYSSRVLAVCVILWLVVHGLGYFIG